VLLIKVRKSYLNQSLATYFNMALYEPFYVKRKKDTTQEEFVRVKLIDLEEVESWEQEDDKHTLVFMKSGDVFMIILPHTEFGDIMFDSVDIYGRWFIFNQN